MHCEPCKFNNPKGTATAVIIREGKIFCLKRNEEPFFGMWDFPGGYMNAGELPEETLRRELKEELGVTPITVDFINWFPGTASWRGNKFAILNHAYLVSIPENFMLNEEENPAYQWFPISSIDHTQIAFDSNQVIIRHVKEKFTVDYASLQNLIRQLDSSAKIDEINFYRSLLNGYCSKKIVDGCMVGVGWIFPRRTLLRNRAVLEDIVVNQSERGKGYGEEITRDLLMWAKTHNVDIVELTTNPNRAAANNLYKKLGFQLHPTNHYLIQVGVVG